MARADHAGPPIVWTDNPSAARRAMRGLAHLVVGLALGVVMLAVVVGCAWWAYTANSGLLALATLSVSVLHLIVLVTYLLDEETRPMGVGLLITWLVEPLAVVAALSPYLLLLW